MPPARPRRRRRPLAIAASVVLVLGLAAYGLWPRPPAAPARVGDLRGFESYLDRLTAFGRPPGLSLVVVKNGRTRYCRGFGAADGPRRLPATPDTVYHWWSMTKIPTAIAVLQLVEAHRLALTDDVAVRLPWLTVR
jgi:CubicO group peptidase (beta-lactamase class C family)